MDFGNLDFYGRSLSLNGLPLITCYSSTINKLNISVLTLDDCLSLLDGRLSQLSTFNVIIDHIERSSLAIVNTMILSNLKCFSLKSYLFTFAYDNEIVPLLRRMSNLEVLTLYIMVKNRQILIDGNHFNNEILVYMPKLNTLNFFIRTVNDIDYAGDWQLKEDIEHSFNNSKWSQVNCWIDHFTNGTELCNIFSLPFTMEYMDGITNSFPGGVFISVLYLSMLDVRPFEHDFFHLIAQAFPSVRKMRLINMIPQLRKQRHGKFNDDNNNNHQNSSIIEFPHLKTLFIPDVHMDYAEEFLHDNNIRLPSLIQLWIKYEQLEIVTNHFTNDRARRNCSNIRSLNIEEEIVFPKNFYLYFPLL